jgi:hypothetical protein
METIPTWRCTPRSTRCRTIWMRRVRCCSPTWAGACREFDQAIGELVGACLLGREVAIRVTAR